MIPVPKESVDQVRGIIRAILEQSASQVFLSRVDAILEEWAAGKLSAAEACSKVQKIVSLFIDENKAREIGARCAPLVTKMSVSEKK